MRGSLSRSAMGFLAVVVSSLSSMTLAAAAEAPAPAACLALSGQSMFEVSDLAPVDLRGCSLEGKFVTVRGHSVAIPEPGNEVSLFGTPDGGGEPVDLMVATSEEGIVSVPIGAEESPDTPETEEAVSRCSSTRTYSAPIRWITRWPAWAVGTSGIPSGMTGTTIQSMLTTANSVWRTPKTSCGLAAGGVTFNPTVTGSLASTNVPEISSAGSCGSRDGRDEVAFGAVDGGYLAWACAWSSNGSILSADIRLDNSSRAWVTSVAGCTGTKYDLLSVITHEVGHGAGLGHTIEEGRGDQTMSPNTSTCDSSARLLGSSDYYTIRYRY